MAIESKKILMHIRKGVVLSTKITYRSARTHPYISIFLFLLLVLYRVFPSLFAFLVSSSPVIGCTAILLGTLLSYGTPNIPEIEEEDARTREISPLQVGSVVDDVVVQPDESFTVETLLETDVVVNRRALEAAVGETSTGAHNEVETYVSSSKLPHEGDLKDDDTSATSFLVQEGKQDVHIEKKLMEETEVADCGYEAMREFSVEKQVEPTLDLDAQARSFAVYDQNELEGLKIQIAAPTFDSPFDSSLGSPWQPVNTFDASYDSESDGSESSSPDASLADIMPMLEELHPLLDSEHPRPTVGDIDGSDDSSSSSSEDHVSDDGIAQDGGDNLEGAGKESQEKDKANEVAVPWTADDQKNVMDLGYSEIERNRRLENLIAKRRLKKLQRFETQKNLIDFDSFYPSSIPSIQAPRRNPFDLDYEFDESLSLPHIPGSAPSVLQPRRNPFDLPYDQVSEVNTLSREYLSHDDFVSAAQREVLSRRNETTIIGQSFSGDQKKEGANLKPYSAAQRTESVETGFTVFDRQFAAPEDHGEGVIEQEIHQDVENVEHDKEEIHQDVENVEQDKEFFEAVDSIDKKLEYGGMCAEIGHSAEFNTSDSIEETQRVVEGNIEEVEDNLPVSYSGELETTEERNEDSNFSLMEESEQISHIHEESAHVEHMKDESLQSHWVDETQAMDAVYDSSPAKTLSNISAPDEALLFEDYKGAENLILSPFPSAVQEDFLEAALPLTPRPTEATLSLETRGEDLACGTGKVVADSADLSLVDENESTMREITEINKHDSLLFEISETSGDVVHPLVAEMESATASHIAHSSSLSSVDSESAQLSEDHPVGVDKSSQFTANHIVNEPPSFDEPAIPLSHRSGGKESEASILNLPSIPEENTVDFILGEEHRNGMHPRASSDSAASQVAEDSNVRILDTEPENMNFSTVLVSKSDHEMGVSNELTDSQSKIKDEISSNQQEVTLISNNSDKEADDEFHAEISGIGEFDENLLSELDVVGDFRVDRELTYNQEGSELALGKLDSTVEGSCSKMQGIQDSTLPPIEDAAVELGVSSETKISNSEQLNPEEAVVPLTGLTSDNSANYSMLHNLEVGSSSLPLGEDPEMTVYNSRLHVLDACSIEELDSIFKQHHEEAMVPPTDLIVESSVTSKTEEETREDQERNGTDTELLVLEATSVEDISSALKQLGEGFSKTSISEAGTSEVMSEETQTETEEMNSDFHVIEAKSLEDINSALKQLSKVTSERSLELVKQDASAQADTSKENFEPEASNSVFHVVEAKSHEDIYLAMAQLSKVSAEKSPEKIQLKDGSTEAVTSKEPLVAGAESSEEAASGRLGPEESKLDL